MKNLIFLSIIILGFCNSTEAQKKKPYLYLEINKNLPVTIKLNGAPVNNERKGYILLTNLQEGINVLNFDFANPDFRNHEFHIDNSKQKSMGLKLARVSDNRFVLQDVVNNQIINDQQAVSRPITSTTTEARKVVIANKMADRNQPKEVVVKKSKSVKESIGNRNERVELKSEELLSKTTTVVKAEKPIANIDNGQRTTRAKSSSAPTDGHTYAMYKNRELLTKNANKRYKNYRKSRRDARRRARELAKLNAASVNTNTSRDNSEQNSNLNIRNKENTNTESRKSKRTNDLGISEQVINPEPLRGSGRNEAAKSEIATRCNSSVRSDRVADWTVRLPKKFDDEAREKYITKKLGDKCIGSDNLSVLLNNMETQIGRYKLIAALYSQLEDPNNINQLYKFFTAQSYIDKLKDLGRGEEN